MIHFAISETFRYFENYFLVSHRICPINSNNRETFLVFWLVLNDSHPNYNYALRSRRQICSNQSMPFLRDDNLTFHRFNTNVSLDDNGTNWRRPSNIESFVEQRAPVAATSHATSHTGLATPNATIHKITAEMTTYPPPIWTTALANSSNDARLHESHAQVSSSSAGDVMPDSNMYKHDYHDFHYLPTASSSAVSRANSVLTNDRHKSLLNGSTAKLMLNDDDSSNKQVSLPNIIIIREEPLIVFHI